MPGMDLLYSLICPDCRSGKILELTSTAQFQRIFHCIDCGRNMQLNDGILFAPPSDSPLGTAANRDYYNEMSESNDNHLIRRVQTRNHKTKFTMLCHALDLNNSPPSKVLELGLGLGAHGAGVLSLGHEYVGLDIAEGLLRSAQANFPILKNALLTSGDATRLPFEENSFDRGFYIAALHHLPDPPLGIKELIRVLKPGGRFCFLEPRRYYPVHAIQFLLHPKTEVSAMKMTPGNISRWLKEAGVTDINLRYCVYTPNGPAPFVPLFDSMDRTFQKYKLHILSVMMCVYGSK